jgi:hypothetical protein
MDVLRDKTNTICAIDYHQQVDHVGTLLTILIEHACLFHDSVSNFDVNDLMIAKDCINRVKGRANE